MTMDDFKAYLDTLPKEKRDEFLGALERDYPGEVSQIRRDYENAERYATTPGPEMRRHGRVSTAAHPLEFAGALAQRGVGQYLRGGAQERSAALSGDKQGALMQLQQAMLNKPGASPAAGVGMADLLRGGRPF